ncbi:MAG: hydroxyisourate hydrolase [Anderseniella sp.]
MNAAANAGRITTHVLDTASGKPAAGLKIDFYRLDATARELIKTVVTNDDGRCDDALLSGDDMTAGVFELVFHVGDYLGRADDVSFLDQVPVRFGIADPASHYHVPLLVSPFGYSTYRGS